MTGIHSAADIPPAAMLRMADVLDTGCLIVDAELIVRGWNDWMESASGKPADKVVGRPLADVVALADDAILLTSLRTALHGEAVVLAHQFHEFVLPFDPPQGFGIPQMQQSARVIPYVLEDGSPGAVALVQDVTERVVRERDLNVSTERAESANKAKSEFLAAMSHELRTPLTAILGYADLLQSEIGGSLTPMHHDHVSRITAGTWHLIRIIDEILSFSRVEAKKYELIVEPVTVRHIVQQAVEMLQPQAELKRVPIDIDLEDKELVIETDALKLRQILVNLLSNAVKFTENGSITVRVHSDRQNVFYSVIDTGSGIPPHMQALIFEPFVQADQSATRAKGGTGLGLALSRGLAELLGGSLTLARTGDAGSEFLLRLPLRHRVDSGNANVGNVDATVGVLQSERDDLIRSQRA
jgi:signal transduction histidine kinase